MVFIFIRTVMSRGLSKEDLEATFDAFLKTSLTSEEDIEKINELLLNPVKAKTKSLEYKWLEDDEEKKGAPGKSFLKGKKPASSGSSGKIMASDNQDLSRSPAGKIPKPTQLKKGKPDRSKGRGGRETPPGKGKAPRGKGFSDMSMSKDSLEDKVGCLSRNVSEKSEEHDLHGHSRVAHQPASSLETSQENTDEIGNLVDSHKSPDKPGFDTLDEMDEKQKFFQDLEIKASGTLDYSQLNRDISTTGPLGMAMDVSGDSPEICPRSDLPVHQETGDISGDKETSTSHQKPSMLSKVSLLDSMDSTLNTSTSPQAHGQDGTVSKDTTQDNLEQTLPEMLKTQGTVGAVGTNTSQEIEELHQALRNVGMSPTLRGPDSQNTSGRPTDRSIGQLFKEMDEIEKRKEAILAEEKDVKLKSDYKTPRAAGIHPQGFVVDRAGGIENSHTEDTEVYHQVTGVPVSEKSSKLSKKSMEKSSSTPISKSVEERGRSMKTRYNHVQSSGYGKRSPEVMPRKSLSPSLSPIRPAGRGRTSDFSMESSRRQRKESASPSPRRQKSETRRPSQTQINHSRSAGKPTSLQDEPTLSRYGGRNVNEMHENVLAEELRAVRNQLQEEQEKNSRLLANQATQEKELIRQVEDQRVEYERQIFQLKQENFVLAARLRDSGVSRVTAGVNSNKDEASLADHAARLEKECKEQEELLARFQSENKRLYEEVRSKEKAARATEEAMFKENQRLIVEMSSVRSLLEQKESELRSKSIITSLPAQQQAVAANQAFVTDLARTVQLETERKECKELEIKHKEEIERLTRKLKWYAENQELLDKSAKTIKSQAEEICHLKLCIEELRSETGQRLEENKLRSKQKSADVKKIQDLERQVKEMEQIIRRRHPNSLPALMMTAAILPDPTQGIGDNRGRTVAVLENSIKRLEGEIEKKDEECATLLRATEQKYNAIKFEERVADLESQLQLYKSQGSGDMRPYEHPHTHTLALERELDSTREKYKKRISELTSQVEKLTGELAKLKKQQDNNHHSELVRRQQVETDLRVQVAALQAVVGEKDKDLASALATVDRLQKTLNGIAESDKGQKNGKTAREQPELQHRSLEKMYKPESFADNHISDVIKENEDLRNKLELLQLERDQQRVDLRRCLAETEAIARRSREDYENQLEAMRIAHKKEITRIKAEQAVYNSTSKLASLQSRCDSQEVMVQHLQRQLAQRDTELEQLAEVKQHETELKQQVHVLQDKLMEAKRTQAPEMRHFEALEEKITRLTERHNKREQELEALVRSSKRMASQDLVDEAARWKKMVESKNMEICKFREELDSILCVLRELQRQGITLPYVMPS